jgi:uncharacterized membrane protein
MKLILQITTGLVLIAYPFTVYFGLQYLPSGMIALLLCALLVTRLVLNKQQLKTMGLPLILGIALTAASFISQRQDWLLYYPVVINLTMLSLFGYSLWQGPSMIERLARLKEPDLPPSATPYLIKITKLWCALFIFNASIATYTAMLSSIEVWTLYNGMIAYLLIGALLGGEWCYRHFRLEKHV